MMTTKKTLIVEEPKVEEPKVEEPKVEEPKVEEPKVEESKVEESKVEAPKAEESEDIYMQVAVPESATLRVRHEPATNSAVVVNVPNKAELRVLGNDNPDWLYVELTDGSATKGFVMRSFVTESD